MKRLSSFFTIAFAILSLAFCSCSDDDNPNPLADSNGTLDISATELSFGIDGGTASFTVNGGTAFVRSEADWLTVKRISGNSETSTFSVECGENKGEQREGTILANLNGAFTRIVVTQQGKVAKPDVTYDFRKASELAKDMYPGWNLGNTLEAIGDGVGAETAWQGTKTTQEIIDFAKAQGFKSVRIPCSWDIHAVNGKIDAEWMARVQEVVDYCIKSGLYVVLNDHYDGGWIEVEGFKENIDEETITAKTTQLKNYWTQIATAFKNYDEHLLFAGLNEPNAANQEQTNILIRYEQAFVDAVRATGGNNSNRTLIVQGPQTNIDNTLKFLNKLPEDKTADRIMVEVHFYDPAQFTGVWENGTPYYFWGSANHVSGSNFNSTWGEEAWITEKFGKLKTAFVDKGYPVIIGEYGANWRAIGENQDKHDASIKSFFYEINRQAVNNGLVTFAWDINSTNQNGSNGIMTILNRANLSVYCKPAMDGITEGTKAGSWPQ